MFAECPNTIITDPNSWGDLPTEFPEFRKDLELPPALTLAERNAKQALDQKNWDDDKIGSLPKSELFYMGLRPVDFLRAFHDTEDSIEKIDALIDLDAEGNTAKMFYTKMNLSSQHINNQFTDKELDGLCYDRQGTKKWYGEKIAEKLSGNLEEIPEVVLDAIQEMNIQQSLGRSSFRNYMRRVNKNINKQKQSISEPSKPKKGKKNKGLLTVQHGKTIVSFK